MNLLSQASGIGPITAIIRAPLDNAAAAYRHIGGLVRILTVPPPLSPPPSLSPQANFERQARMRGYAKPEAYEKLCDSLWRKWVGSLGAAVLLLCLGILSIRSPMSLFSIGLALFSILPAPVAFFVLGIRPSFQQFQLRHRATLSFKEYLKNPGEWLPIPAADAKKTAARWAGVLLLLSMIPASAWAQVSGTATTASQDIGLNMLNALMPTGGSALSRTIQILSATLMWCGAWMLGYHMFMLVVNAAHEGTEALRMNTAWAPLQFCLGVGLLAPIPATGTGQDGMQFAVYYTAEQSLTLANNMWSEFVSQSLPSSATVNPQNSGLIQSDMTSAMSLTHQIADLELCGAMETYEVKDTQQTMKKFFGVDDDEGTSQWAPPVAGTTEANAIVWSYGTCGSFLMPLTSTAGVTDSALVSATTAYDTARHNALTALVTTLRQPSEFTQQLITGSFPSSSPNAIDPAWPDVTPIINSLTTAATTYDNAMQKAATDYLSTRDANVYSTLQTAAKNLGFMSAGSYWRTLTQIGDNLSTLQSASPEFAGNSFWMGQTPLDDDALRIMSHFDSDWNAATVTTPLTAADLAASDEKSSGFLGKVLAPMWNPLMTRLISFGSVNPTDSEESFISLGDTVSDIGMIGIGVGTVASVATGNIGGKFIGAASAFEWLSPWARIIIDICLVLGTFLTYVLPVLPWIAVMWAVVGLLIFWAEAFVAAPLYAFLFIRADGQALVDSVQRPGFVLLFNLYLYPALVVAGLCCAYELIPIAESFLLSQFANAFVGQQGGNLVGMIGVLTAIALCAYLAFVMQLKILELVHLMPERIPRWLGTAMAGLAEGIGDTSNRIYGAVSSNSSKVTGAVGGGKKNSAGGKAGPKTSVQGQGGDNSVADGSEGEEGGTGGGNSISNGGLGRPGTPEGGPGRETHGED